MAVKVMVAPAIVNGEIEKQSEPARRREPAAAKPKRRRSSIYDADGNEVFITLMCLKCHKMRPLSQFGLRKMADGAIRNQPWCRPCRSAATSDKPRRKESAEIVDSPVAAVSPEPAPAPAAAAPAPVQATPPVRRPGSSLATDIAIALERGLRR
jgi:hypothetical protein